MGFGCKPDNVAAGGVLRQSVLRQHKDFWDDQATEQGTFFFAVFIFCSSCFGIMKVIKYGKENKHHAPFDPYSMEETL